MPDLASVAAGAVLLGHLEQIVKLVLGGLAFAAHPEVEGVHKRDSDPESGRAS